MTHHDSSEFRFEKLHFQFSCKITFLLVSYSATGSSEPLVLFQTQNEISNFSKIKGNFGQGLIDYLS